MNPWERLRREGAYALVALQFLTRLPVPQLAGFEATWLDRSTAYFPLTGTLVGAFSAAVVFAASAIWPQPLPALLAVVATIVLTGALHEDGLADTADGLGGGRTRPQRLAIMKDSRLGTYGVLALGSIVALKTACLTVMEPAAAALALILAHGGARLVLVAGAALMPYGGDTDAAKIAPIAPASRRIAFAVVTGLLPFLLIPVLPAVFAVSTAACASALLLAEAQRAIGGYTGDVLGAAEQVFEVTVLLVLAGALG